MKLCFWVMFGENDSIYSEWLDIVYLQSFSKSESVYLQSIILSKFYLQLIFLSTVILNDSQPVRVSIYSQYGVATISRLLEIQVSFAGYSLFYKVLLQKKPINLRSLLIVATP